MTNKFYFQLSSLCRKLDEIWEENRGDVVLFSWISFLKDESIEYLDISSPLNISNVIQRHKKHKPLQNIEVKVSESFTIIDPVKDRFVIEYEPPDPRAVQDIGSQKMLLKAILDYNEEQKVKEFKATFFSCEVCDSEKLGTLCTRYMFCIC